MQQPPQANVPPVQFPQAPLPPPLGYLAGPSYGQGQSGSFDPSSSSSNSFGQYQQIQLYPSEQPNNGSVQAQISGQFLAIGNTQKGRPGASKGSKSRDKSEESQRMERKEGEGGELLRPGVERPKENGQLEGQIPGNSCTPLLYAPGFGPFDAEYAMGGGWMGGLPAGYPQLTPSSGPMLAGQCLGPEEMGGLGLYGPNGLMALPGQLPYDLDPMNAAGYGLWPPGGGGGYYLGMDQAKLLADGNYLNGTSNGHRFPGSAQAPIDFYGPLQATPASIDGSTFPNVSTLPPPPSQLASADQLYGLPNNFPPLAPQEGVNGLPNSSSSSGAPPLIQLGQAALGHAPLDHFYPPPPQPDLFVPEQGMGQGPNAGETPKFRNSAMPSQSSGSRQPLSTAGPSTSGPVKKSGAMKGHLKGASSLSRPGTSASQNMVAERGGSSPQEKRKSRARSLVKDSDDEKSAEEREVERRNANNTRERIRVRDINAAFKELARLCSQHLPNTDERGLTKLNTLLRAVDLIPMLEKKVEEKNRNILDPRRECLKQRMEAGPPAGQMHSPGLGPAPHPAGLPQMLPLPSFPSSSGAPSSSLLSLGPNPSGGPHFD